MPWPKRASLVFFSILAVAVFHLTYREPSGTNDHTARRTASLSAGHAFRGLGAVEDEGDDDIEIPAKVIVMAAREHEDTTWVQRDLSGWHHALYMINSSHAPATISSAPPNEPGRPLAHARLHAPNQTITYLPRRNVAYTAGAAVPYIIYLLSHYDRLPEVMVFLSPSRDGRAAVKHASHVPSGEADSYEGTAHEHDDARGRRKSRHHDDDNNDQTTPDLTNVFKLHALDLAHVVSVGFANLQCALEQGCSGTTGHDLGAGSLRPRREAKTHISEDDEDNDGSIDTDSDFDFTQQVGAAFASMWSFAFQGGDMAILSGSARARLRARASEALIKAAAAALDSSSSSSSPSSLTDPIWEDLPSLALPHVVGAPLGGEFVVTAAHARRVVSRRRLQALLGWFASGGAIEARGGGRGGEMRWSDEVLDHVGQYLWGILFGGDDVS